MKKIMILISIFLILFSSCNLDSEGIFEQIYNETEKNNVFVDYLVGKYNDSYYFSTEKNSIAKYSPIDSGSSYSGLSSVSGAKVRFITSNGYAVCSKMDAISSYYVVDIHEGRQNYNPEPIKLTILVDGNEVVLAGEYFNDIGGDHPLTLLLKKEIGKDKYNYYFYYGEQPEVTIDSSTSSATINFFNLANVTPSETESSPSIIGPGKITYSTYKNENEQSSWKIGDSFVYSRPLLWIDNLLILRNGKVYTFGGDTWTEVSADTDSLTDYDGDILIAAGYDDDKTLYGITDRFSFKYSSTEGFKTNVKSVNITYIGLIKTADGFKAATTENGIKDFDISSL